MYQMPETKTEEAEQEIREEDMTPAEKMAYEFAIMFHEPPFDAPPDPTAPKRIGRPFVRYGKTMEQRKLDALKKFYIDHRCLAYDEIADLMGISKPTARNIEFRALAKLKAGLQKFGIKSLDDIIEHKDRVTADIWAPSGAVLSNRGCDDVGDDDAPVTLVECRQNSDGTLSEVKEEKLGEDVMAIINTCNEEDM